MIELEIPAIVVAAVVAVVFAAVYYSLLAEQAARMSAAWAEQPGSPARLLAFELAKSFVIALVVAGLISLLGIADPSLAVVLGLVLWFAFPVLLLAGSVVHENVPWRLAAIHGGDWLAKMLIIAAIVTIWP